MTDLFSKHRETLEKAVDACDKRYSWTAYPESPSSKIWGHEKPAAGKARRRDRDSGPVPSTAHRSRPHVSNWKQVGEDGSWPGEARS